MIGARLAIVLMVLLASATAVASLTVLRAEPDAEPVGPVPEYEFADMLQAADAFLASLEPDQRSQATFEFDDAELDDLAVLHRERAVLVGVEVVGQVLQLGRRDDGHVHAAVGNQLQGWPVAVFCLGLVLVFSLHVLKVRGGILISIVLTTCYAYVLSKRHLKGRGLLVGIAANRHPEVFENHLC